MTRKTARQAYLADIVRQTADLMIERNDEQEILTFLRKMLGADLDALMVLCPHEPKARR